MQTQHASHPPSQRDPFERLAPNHEARLVRGTNPRITARMLGVLALMTILGGIFAQALVSDRLLVFSDAAATANNVLANRTLFQISLTVYLVEMICQVASVALHYILFSPVSRSVALVAAFVELSGSIIKTMSRLFYIAPLWVLSSGSQALGAFNAEQLRALALLLFKLNDRGAALALGFFGVSGILVGYLIFKSTFLPRTLGVLAMIASAGWLRFLYPPLRQPSFIVIAVVALLTAAVQIFWLIVFAVDAEKWKEQYRRSIQAV